jgi:phosphatidylserine/phosphatidylglycerophosphate/cardiolipin synthase-like enzyme
VRIDARYTVMHDKFMVIDGSSVQTGSFNYTNGAAQSHAENALWIRGDAGVTSQFEQEWERLWAESDSYNG